MLARGDAIHGLKVKRRGTNTPPRTLARQPEETAMTTIANLDEFILEETDDGIFLTVTGDDEKTLKLRVTLDDLEEIVEVIDEVFGLEEDDGEEVEESVG
jgi:hypothetical protein